MSHSLSQLGGGADLTIHGPFRGADVRPGEPIRAKMLLDGSVTIAVQVWKISPLAIELVNHPDVPLEVGATVHLRLELGSQVTSFEELKVASVRWEHGRELIGLRWQEPPAPRPVSQRRAGDRWNVAEDYVPTATAVNPLRFNDLMLLRVNNISGHGLGLLTSLRNKHIVPGMHLDTTLTFPAVGHARVRVRTVHTRVVREEGKQQLALGVELENPDSYTKRMMGQYLLEVGPKLSLTHLRSSGLLVESAMRAVTYDYASTPEEYRQVLELRKLAYSQAGKLATDLAIEDAGDEFDRRARIIVGRYGGEVVASMRLMFHEAGDLMEHEQYIQLPDDLPPRDQIVEITRVCTHPDFRGSDLLLGLFKQCVIAILQSGRQYLLGSSTAKLLPIYTRIGCRVLPVSYRHQGLGGDEHHLFVGDVRGALDGTYVGPFTWNIMFGDVWDHMRRNDLYHPGAMTSMRLGFYRMLNPLARRMMARLKKPRKAPGK